MKYKYSILVGLGFGLAVSLGSGCASLRHDRDPWWGEDKAQHFVAGGLAGAAGAFAARQSDLSDGASFGIGIGVSLGLGAAKEAYDLRIKRTYFSGKDLVWDLLGGAAGSLAVVGLD